MYRISYRCLEAGGGGVLPRHAPRPEPMSSRICSRLHACVLVRQVQSARSEVSHPVEPEVRVGSGSPDIQTREVIYSVKLRIASLNQVSVCYKLIAGVGYANHWLLDFVDDTKNDMRQYIRVRLLCGGCIAPQFRADPGSIPGKRIWWTTFRYFCHQNLYLF